ncbi:hypothetical protein VB735_16520 [Halotia wernerae UHCC 0503]|nr:hypothetical protein [Halotia wernerae UHCC 0503]
MTNEKLNRVINIGNEKLVLTVDEPDAERYLGDVLITPPFGITAKKMFTLSYFLVRNGFRVFSLDFRNHVGESFGEISDARLSKQVEDILEVLLVTDIEIIVSLSLSARAALRACAMCERSLHGVFIAPVVDVRSTLHAVNGQDVFDIIQSGEPGLDMLGYYVKNTFIEDCIRYKFENCQDTIKDFSSIKGQITVIAGDSDPWVSFKSIQDVLDSISIPSKNTKLISIKAASHKIDRNPAVASTYFEAASRECLNLLGRYSTPVEVPNFRDIVRDANNR